MGIFKKAADVFRANVNDLVDKAENPEKMVKLIIIDMEKEVENCTKALGQVMGNEKQILKQLDNQKAQVSEWEDKAKLALKAGNTELAKTALTRKVTAESGIASLQASYDSISAQVADLKEKVKILKTKLEEARVRQNMLLARSQAAKAQQAVAKSVSSTNSSSAFSKLDKMESKIEMQEAQAQSFSDINGDVFAKDEFKELKTKGAVDLELERLMKEMEESK